MSKMPDIKEIMSTSNKEVITLVKTEPDFFRFQEFKQQIISIIQ